MSNTASSNSLQVRRLTYAALCLALAIVLPFLTAQNPQLGNILCLMHIPVLLCGFLCGWQWGLGVGFIAPLLRFLLLSKPPMPTALTMAFELAAYGCVCGFLYRKFPKTIPGIYATLVIAMVTGRIIWGLVSMLLLGNAFTFSVFITNGITTAIPGIIVQLVLIPVIVYALEKAGMNLNHDGAKA